MKKIDRFKELSKMEKLTKEEWKELEMLEEWNEERIERRCEKPKVTLARFKELSKRKKLNKVEWKELDMLEYWNNGRLEEESNKIVPVVHVNERLNKTRLLFKK